MAIKQSLEENKDFILESLPTQELKDQFLKEMEKAPTEVVKPSLEEQIKEAEVSEFATADRYEGIKKALENQKPTPKLSVDEEKAAIEEGLKNPPKPA